MRLVFLFVPGCSACEEAKPHLAAFERRRRDVTIIRVNLLEANWNDPAWSPTATPTYVLEIHGKGRTRWEGTLTAHEIEKFIIKSKNILGA